MFDYIRLARADTPASVLLDFMDEAGGFAVVESTGLTPSFTIRQNRHPKADVAGDVDLSRLHEARAVTISGEAWAADSDATQALLDAIVLAARDGLTSGPTDPTPPYKASSSTRLMVESQRSPSGLVLRAFDVKPVSFASKMVPSGEMASFQIAFTSPDGRLFETTAITTQLSPASAGVAVTGSLALGGNAPSPCYIEVDGPVTTDGTGVGATLVAGGQMIVLYGATSTNIIPSGSTLRIDTMRRTVRMWNGSAETNRIDLLKFASSPTPFEDLEPGTVSLSATVQAGITAATKVSFTAYNAYH